MHYKAIHCVFFISLCVSICSCLGISSKLDFGESQSVSKLVKSIPEYRAVILEPKKKSDGLETIGIVCVTEGCNQTETKNQSNSDFETDIVVHVKANLNPKPKQETNFTDSTPDVPIVVGLAGSNSADNNAQDRAFDNKPIIVTTKEDIYPPFSIKPLYSPAISTISSSFTPNIFTSGGSNVAQNRFHPHVTSNTYPSITVTMSDDGRSIKDIRYNSNSLAPRTPHYDPSYNNHYFGEHPPSSLVWYPKNTDTINPVEFRNTAKPVWNPSIWTNQFNPNPMIHHKHSSENEEKCQCKNAVNTGLQWYPKGRVYGALDPGSQINDKLAPLN